MILLEYSIIFLNIECVHYLMEQVYSENKF